MLKLVFNLNPFSLSNEKLLLKANIKFSAPVHIKLTIAKSKHLGSNSGIPNINLQHTSKPARNRKPLNIFYKIALPYKHNIVARNLIECLNLQHLF